MRRGDRHCADHRVLEAQALARRGGAARAAAAADPNLAAGLAMELGAISTAEDTRCDKLRREVYIGLVEVAAVPDSSPAPAPLINPPKPHHDADISCMQELEDEYVLGWQACAHHFYGVQPCPSRRHELSVYSFRRDR